MIRPVITIDGPAGAGKSTVASLVADALGYKRINTGLLYRAIAYLARERKLDPNDSCAIGELASTAELSFTEDGQAVLVGDGPVLTVHELHRPDVSEAASIVSQYRGVRTALLTPQRAFAAQGGVIFEGRDTGSVIVPDAQHKFYLTANAEVRAKRRAAEQGLDWREIHEAMLKRDARDQKRDTAPLVAPADATILDASDLSAEAVAERIVAAVSG